MGLPCNCNSPFHPLLHKGTRIEQMRNIVQTYLPQGKADSLRDDVKVNISYSGPNGCVNCCTEMVRNLDKPFEANIKARKVELEIYAINRHIANNRIKQNSCDRQTRERRASVAPR